MSVSLIRTFVIEPWRYSYPFHLRQTCVNCLTCHWKWEQNRVDWGCAELTDLTANCISSFPALNPKSTWGGFHWSQWSTSLLRELGLGTRGWIQHPVIRFLSSRRPGCPVAKELPWPAMLHAYHMPSNVKSGWRAGVSLTCMYVILYLPYF